MNRAIVQIVSEVENAGSQETYQYLWGRLLHHGVRFDGLLVDITARRAYAWREIKPEPIEKGVA